MFVFFLIKSTAWLVGSVDRISCFGFMYKSSYFFPGPLIFLKANVCVCVWVCVCVCECVCVLSHVWPTLCDATDCSLPGSSVHGGFQARILEWVAILPPGDFLNPVKEPESPASPALACRFFTIEPPEFVLRHFMYVLYYAKSYLPGPWYPGDTPWINGYILSFE